jgi:hypothetical protein
VIKVKTTVRLDSLRRFRRALSGRTSRVRKALIQWGTIYKQFILARFRRYSKGGGNWRKLRPATIAAKKRRGIRNPSLILQATKLMLKTIDPSFQSVSGVRSNRPFQATVSFGGNAKYPDGTSVTSVMGYHDRGGGTLPQRKIFVQADQATKVKMAAVMKKAVLQDARR